MRINQNPKLMKGMHPGHSRKGPGIVLSSEAERRLGRNKMEPRGKRQSDWLEN